MSDREAEIKGKVENIFPEKVLVKITCRQVITGIEERQREPQTDLNKKHQRLADEVGLRTARRSNIVDAGFHVIDNGKNVSLASFLIQIKAWNLIPTAVFWQAGRNGNRVYCIEFSEEGTAVQIPVKLKRLLQGFSAYIHVWMNVSGIEEWDVVGTKEEVEAQVPVDQRTQIGTDSAVLRKDTVNLIIPDGFSPNGKVYELMLGDKAGTYSLKRLES